MGTLNEHLSIICHQLRSPDNLGAIARVLANFGLDRLVLSDPATYGFRDAEKTGVKAQHVLEQMQVVRTLDEALADCVYSLGTTSRGELRGRSPLTPEAAVSRLVEHCARGKVALVFGGEKRGLSDGELGRCQDVLVIPTSSQQPSMNVAQAVAVLTYLCARQVAAAPATAEPAGARTDTLRALEAALGTALGKSEFLNPQAPDYIIRELSRTLSRAKLTQREAELWISALRHIDRKLVASS